MYDPYTLNKLGNIIHEERLQAAATARLVAPGPSLMQRLSAFVNRLAAPVETRRAQPVQRPTHITQEIPAAR